MLLKEIILESLKGEGILFSDLSDKELVKILGDNNKKPMAELFNMETNTLVKKATLSKVVKRSSFGHNEALLLTVSSDFDDIMVRVVNAMIHELNYEFKLELLEAHDGEKCLCFNTGTNNIVINQSKRDDISFFVHDYSKTNDIRDINDVILTFGITPDKTLNDVVDIIINIYRTFKGEL